jgi:hypothetical protein
LPKWLAADGSFAPLPERGEEDLLDAAVEGRVSLVQLRAMRDEGRLGEDGLEALEEMEMTSERVETFLAEATPPGGMDERLGENLRGHMSSDAGQVDENVAARLLGGEAKGPKKGLGIPDVRAASAEDEEQV